MTKNAFQLSLISKLSILCLTWFMASMGYLWAAETSVMHGGANGNSALDCQDDLKDCRHDSSFHQQPTNSHANKTTAAKLPTAAGQSMFGAISEIHGLIEEGETNWQGVDFDRLWEHLKDMNALMVGAVVQKSQLDNGLRIRVSGEGQTKRAMDNMLPAHTAFLKTVRPEWDMTISEIGNDYQLHIVSDKPREVLRIQSLGFAGFMVQDDHHAEHHLGLALGEVVH